MYLSFNSFLLGRGKPLGEKWVAPTLDHILQDQSPDHSPVQDQDLDHTLGKSDTGMFLAFTLFTLHYCEY